MRKLIVLILGCIIAMTSWAGAQTINANPSMPETLISSCPYTITSSGTYTLENNISSTGTCITINAAGVTLDCQRYTLQGIHTENSYGIIVNAHNVAVKNCVVNHFDFGIEFNNGVQNGTIIGNTVYSNNRGIYIMWNDNNYFIANNLVNSSRDFGIWLYHGSNDKILNNTFTGNSNGMWFYPECYNNIIANNTITFNWDKGIWLVTSLNNTFTSNIVQNNLPWDYYSQTGSVNNTVTNLTMLQNVVDFNGKDIALKGLASGPNDPPGYENIGRYVNATAISSDSWLNITIGYKDSDVTDESSLRIWKNNGTWTNESFYTTNGVNTGKNIAYAYITGLGGVFAPLETSTGPKIMISEIYYNTTNNSQNQYIELYVFNNSGGDVNISGWRIETNNFNKSLPDIAGVENFDYIVLHAGYGTDELNATDGNATVYANNTTLILNDRGHATLYDAAGNLRDFVRYNNDSGPVQGNWPVNDPGTTAKNINESIQVHGPDYDNSSNWISGPVSENAPNIYEWVMNESQDLRYQIHNGLNYPMNVSDGISSMWNITDESGTFTPDELKVIEEMLDFTYAQVTENLGGVPQRAPDKKIHVYITKNGKYTGSASERNKGQIVVDIGDLKTFDSKVLAKHILEHEQMHLFQYNSSRGWSSSMSDHCDIEGEAEFWATVITMKEYGITFWQYINITKKYFPDRGPESWLNDTDPIYFGPFTNFEEITRNYWANHLLFWYINDTYGNDTDVLYHIYRVRDVPSGMVGKKTIEKAFEIEGKSIKFKDVFIGYTYYLWKNFKGMITLKKNIVYPGGTVNMDVDEYFHGGDYGIRYEMININTNTPFNITFSGQAGSIFAITVLKINGSTEKKEVYEFNGGISIPVEKGYEKVVLIKTVLNDTFGGWYNVTLINTTAAADVDGCMNLDTPGGKYALVNDIPDAAPHCLYVQANNVELDCDGYTIQGGSYTVIGSDYSLSGVTVKNCNLIDGDVEFLDLNSGNVLDNAMHNARILVSGLNNKIAGNNGDLVVSGLNNKIAGNDEDLGSIIEVIGNGNEISGNSMSGVPDSTIYVQGSSNNILNNEVTLYGIDVEMGSGNVVAGNVIRNCQQGIFLYDVSGGTVSGNNVTWNQNGIALYSSYGNLVYNNYLNNTANAYDDGTNYWNATAGNTWSDCLSNPGYPSRYIIPGPGGGTDWKPVCPDVCSDGTPLNQCSATKPLFCAAKTLVKQCKTCGCPSYAPICRPDGSCSTNPVSGGRPHDKFHQQE